jgi:hypothetical protein
LKIGYEQIVENRQKQGPAHSEGLQNEGEGKYSGESPSGVKRAKNSGTTTNKRT